MHGYIGGKTIAIGSWGFSLRVFSTHQSGTQRNLYILGIGGRTLGVADYSQQQECRRKAWVV